MSDILATISPRPGRRWLGIALQAVLGGLLVAVALGLRDAPLLGRALVLGFGVLTLFGAVRLFHATALHLELTETELRDSSGRVLAHVDNVVGIDRGAFAFKPSNGFLIRLAQPDTRTWAPGVWWRVGKFVGVGGVTPAGEAKAVAEILSMLVAKRNGGEAP